MFHWFNSFRLSSVKLPHVLCPAGGQQYKPLPDVPGSGDYGPGGRVQWEKPPHLLQRLQTHLPAQGQSANQSVIEWVSDSAESHRQHLPCIISYLTPSRLLDTVVGDAVV